MSFLPLCSLARNPDGSLVRPTTYEINDSITVNLTFGALGVLLFVWMLSTAIIWLKSQRLGLGSAGVGTVFMLFHPYWTVGTSGGDCGEIRVYCSWLVLGLETVLALTQLVLLFWRFDTSPDKLDYDDQAQFQ